jgi:hypothetical protein
LKFVQCISWGIRSFSQGEVSALANQRYRNASFRNAYNGLTRVLDCDGTPWNCGRRCGASRTRSSAYREVPPGRGGLSFSLDPDHATLRGPGPKESVQANTVDYEALAGRRRFTLFDVSAISGAAFSP